MGNGTIDYFNGVFASAYKVRLELVNHRLHLYDAAYNSDNGLAFDLSDCHSVLLKGKAFVYLDKASSKYIVLPADNEHYAAILEGIKSTRTGWHEKLLGTKWYVLLSISAGVILCIYFLLNIILPAIALKVISVDEEISMGDQFYQSFTENAIVDSTKTFMLQKFADGLTLSNKYPIKVTVVRDDIVNAFALPGGHLVVYTGIINKMENAQELVALLSHESSHVNKRHSLKSMLSRLSSSIAISLLTKDLNGVSRGLIDNVNMLQVLSYSRDLESEADEEGMKLMVANHINPIGMEWLMEDLQKMDKDIPSKLSFLSTHPLTKERVKKAKAFAKDHNEFNGQMNEKLVAMWDELKRND